MSTRAHLVLEPLGRWRRQKPAIGPHIASGQTRAALTGAVSSVRHKIAHSFFADRNPGSGPSLFRLNRSKFALESAEFVRVPANRLSPTTLCNFCSIPSFPGNYTARDPE
jgi:hypothetical protein